MKGVSSDVAARQVRMACQSKKDEYKKGIAKTLEREYGELIANDKMLKSKYYEEEGAGFSSMQYTNQTTNKTITFIRLRIAPAPASGAQCDFSKQFFHTYRVKVKPRDNISLVYPSPTGSDCVDLVTVRGLPTSWSDVSFSSKAQPLANDPFADVDPFEDMKYRKAEKVIIDGKDYIRVPVPDPYQN